MYEIDAAVRGKSGNAKPVSQPSDADERGSRAWANSEVEGAARKECPGRGCRTAIGPAALHRYYTKTRLERVMLTQTNEQPVVIHHALDRYLENGNGVPQPPSSPPQPFARLKAAG